MTSLKQLRIKGSSELTTFPAGIGRLTSLVRLDRFILTEGQCNLSELRHLNRIRGSLRIKKLELGSREEAVNAKLEDKTFLKGLELRWKREEQDEPSRAEGVLEALRPPPTLQNLLIYRYPGLKFPGWVGEPTFNGLRTLRIEGCDNLRSLPEEFMSPLSMGLQELSISDCPLLEDVSWKMGVHLPCLRMLQIWNCGNLKVFPLIVSEALKEVVIAGCPNLTDVGSIPSGVEKLKLHLSPAKMLSTLPSLPMLKYLEIIGDDDVIELPHDLIRLTDLQTLRIVYCKNLRSLPEEMSSLKKLRELEFYGCPNLGESCKMGGEQWSKIAHIPRITIDHDIIQDNK